VAGGAVSGGRLVPAHYSQPGEAGVRQFLDIGTGLPAAGSVHEIAQDLAPASRVVYVDNDPIVLGVVRVPEWRPSSAEAAASPSTQWGGVGRKA
jgi:hypothetical protein